ncbi:MAG TPA: hypothetical protein VGQ35_21245 [Dongiaceae bacterium]|nr:hypothetical protein [Dongiaceae bacterium]
MKLATIALACLGLSAATAAAEGPPVIIAPGQVDSELAVNTRDFKGHRAWSMVWYRDAQGRELHIGYIEGLEMPYRKRPVEMMKVMHDDSSDDEAELRQNLEGRSEQLWGLDVFWLVASERAVMEPDPAKPETVKDGKLHRGEARRNCAVFTAHPDGRTATPHRLLLPRPRAGRHGRRNHRTPMAAGAGSQAPAIEYRRTPGAMTPLEWRIMKRAAIVGQCRFDSPLSTAARKRRAPATRMRSARPRRRPG